MTKAMREWIEVTKSWIREQDARRVDCLDTARSVESDVRFFRRHIKIAKRIACENRSQALHYARLSQQAQRDLDREIALERRAGKRKAPKKC